MQGNYTMSELIKILNEKETVPVFNNSVISKYINTCRYCGIDIPKIHNKYFVATVPFGLSLSLTEIDLLKQLQRFVHEELPAKSFKIFQNFIEKINMYSNKKIARLEQKNITESFEQFENAVIDRRMVKLLFKNQTSLTGIPIKVSNRNGKTFFNIFCKNRERMIDIGRLAGLEVLSEKFIQNFNKQTVIYRLTGDLSKRYTVKETENVLNCDEDSITISNTGEDRESLFSRLLRYDDKCEIITPKDYRIAMKQIIDEALLNYGE